MSDSAPRRRLSLPPSGPRASQPDPAPPRPPRPAGPRPAGRFTVRAPEAGAAAARTAPAGREARAPSRAGPGAARTSAPMGAPAGGTAVTRRPAPRA
ncbi:hypothetical protein GO496_09510 [Acidovorax citrulli]|nr:hypothetical protein [Paracidovorax citrulli]